MMMIKGVNIVFNKINYDELVSDTFKEHGVDSPDLEKAISAILNKALDPDALSKQIYENVTERQERDKRTRERFRG